MALGCQSVAQVAGAGSEFLATSVRAQTALQVGRVVSDSQATRHAVILFAMSDHQRRLLSAILIFAARSPCKP